MKRPEDIKKEYERYTDDYTAYIELWQAVRIVTKKNGEPFQSTQRNYEGARYVVEYGLHRLYVYGRNSKGCYINDYINIEDRNQPNGTLYTPAQVKEMILDHIEKMKSYINDYKKVIAQAEAVGDLIKRHTEEIKKELDAMGAPYQFKYSMTELFDYYYR